MMVAAPLPEPPRAGWNDAANSHELTDTAADVDAAFRTLRRVNLTYFAVFLLVIAAFPVASLTLRWWTQSRIFGQLSPAFAVAAMGMYVVFAGIGIAAATLSSSVESRMLGQQHEVHDGADEP